MRASATWAGQTPGGGSSGCGRDGIDRRWQRDVHTVHGGSDERESVGAAELRFDARMAGEGLPTVPAKFRGIDGLTGRLVGARLRASTGEGWLRLRTGRWGKRAVTTVPLTTAQSPVPTPDAIELRSGMRVHCHEGYVGRLHGLTVDTRRPGW